MSEASSQPTADDLAERVRDLFADAETVLPTDQSTAAGAELADELSDAERTDVRDLADDAADLLDTGESEALLAALGLGGSDGPGSIPAAILAGDSDDVADLRALLALSRLAPDEDDDGPFDEREREAMATLTDLLGDESADESGTSDGASETAEGDAGDDETGTEAGDGESDAAEAESGDEGGDEITSALEDALDEVQTGLGDALGIDGDPDDADAEDGDDDLVEAAGDLVDKVGDRIADATSGETEGESEEAADDDGGEADAESEDDGLLGLGDQGGRLDNDEDDGMLGGEDSPGDESVSGFGRTKHSTIPSQDRADMSGVRRYSTMPDR